MTMIIDQNDTTRELLCSNFYHDKTRDRLHSTTRLDHSRTSDLKKRWLNNATPIWLDHWRVASCDYAQRHQMFSNSMHLFARDDPFDSLNIDAPNVAQIDWRWTIVV